MAQTVHLMLKIDGNDIEGESTVTSMDRENTIECLSFERGGPCRVVLDDDIATAYTASVWH